MVVMAAAVPVDVAEARRVLAALIASVEAGELAASATTLAALRGALAALDSLSDHKPTV